MKQKICSVDNINNDNAIFHSHNKFFCRSPVLPAAAVVAVVMKNQNRSLYHAATVLLLCVSHHHPQSRRAYFSSLKL